MKIKRGDVFYCDFQGNVGSEQGGVRPVVVIQNNVGNKYSPTTIIAPITGKMDKHNIPTHVRIGQPEYLQEESQVLLEQVKVADKRRLLEYRGQLTENQMKLIDRALVISMGIGSACCCE